MSVSAWGRSVGLSRQGALAAVLRCGVPRQDGKVSKVIADALYKARTATIVRATLSKQVQPPAAPVGENDISHAEAKRREAVARAKLAELDAAQRAAEMLPAAAVQESWSRILSDCRQRLLSVPSRLASEIADGAGRAEVALVAERLLHEALNELADGRRD